MPLIFIHGVANRKGPEYDRGVAARNALFKSQFLEPLSKRAPKFAGMEIANPYWGDDGAQFAWGMRCLPDISLIQDLGIGGADDTTGRIASARSQIELQATIQSLAPAAAPGRVADLGIESGSRLKQAALADMPRFVEAILAPIMNQDIALQEGATPEQLGELDAQVLVAAYSAATDQALRTEIEQASTDEEVLATFRTAIVQRLTPEPKAGKVQDLGIMEHLPLVGKVTDIFERVVQEAGRVITLPILDMARSGANAHLSMFVGDVCVYLLYKTDKKPDGSEEPGAILKTVYNGIVAATKGKQNEPLIVVTHSMGGNIFYDLITHFYPKFKVDVWISVGGQVGLFEEMKLFADSDEKRHYPDTVKLPGSNLGAWSNFYDPADVVSFKAEPIFSRAHDVRFSTGICPPYSHSEYFKRPSFYAKLVEEVAGILL